MNPAYAHARFRADLPPSGLPERFGVVTAWNPDGITSEREINAAANTRLEARAREAGLKFFPVTGGSHDFAHAEPGFGIIADRELILALGREFTQEAVFWIERGEVHLCPCNDEPSEHLGSWQDRFVGRCQP